ncbi:MAG: insulinase family protein [Parcubacteria group bacterium]|nr:insulinase family protein [Parcubacteria group bacterium]
MKTRQLPFHPYPAFSSTDAFGLDVITMHTPSDLVRLCLVFRCGGMHFEVPGAAHLLEHLLFHGPAREHILHPLLMPLAHKGVEADAYTDYAYTGYAVSGHVDDTAPMLDALLKMGFGASFTSDMIEKERAVISSETLLKLSFNRWLEWRQRLLYPSHGAAHQPVIGSPESLQRVTGESLMLEYAKWYRPEHAAVIVVGNIPHERILKQLTGRELLTGIPAPRQEPLFPDYADSAYATRTEDPVPQISWYFRRPSDEAEEALFALAVNVICDHQLCLLDQAMRIKHAGSYGVRCALMSYPFKDVGITVECAPELFPTAETEIQNAIEAVCECRVPEITFRAVVGNYLLDRRVEAHEVSGDDWVKNFTANWLDGSLESGVDHETIVRNATPQDLAAVAQKYLAQGHGAMRVVWE